MIKVLVLWLYQSHMNVDQQLLTLLVILSHGGRQMYNLEKVIF